MWTNKFGLRQIHVWDTVNFTTYSRALLAIVYVSDMDGQIICTNLLCILKLVSVQSLWVFRQYGQMAAFWCSACAFDSTKVNAMNDGIYIIISNLCDIWWKTVFYRLLWLICDADRDGEPVNNDFEISSRRCVQSASHLDIIGASKPATGKPIDVLDDVIAHMHILLYI